MHKDVQSDSQLSPYGDILLLLVMAYYKPLANFPLVSKGEDQFSMPKFDPFTWKGGDKHVQA